MADTVSMALAELLRKADAEPDIDTLREGVRVMSQALMELEVAQHLGAERYQRTPDRQGGLPGLKQTLWTEADSLESSRLSRRRRRPQAGKKSNDRSLTPLDGGATLDPGPRRGPWAPGRMVKPCPMLRTFPRASVVQRAVGPVAGS